MAHFAELDSNNRMTRVIVIVNEEIQDWEEVIEQLPENTE